MNCRIISCSASFFAALQVLFSAGFFTAAGFSVTTAFFVVVFFAVVRVVFAAFAASFLLLCRCFLLLLRFPLQLLLQLLYSFFLCCGCFLLLWSLLLLSRLFCCLSLGSWFSLHICFLPFGWPCIFWKSRPANYHSGERLTLTVRTFLIPCL